MALASEMLYLGGKGSPEKCRELAENAVSSGKALDALRKMIALQGGNPAVIDDYSLFKQAERCTEVYADRSGYITKISCERTGLISLELGAGRKTKESDIDFSAGILLNKTVGEYVNKGEKIAVLYTSSQCSLQEIAEEFKNVISIEEKESLLSEKISQKNIIKILRTS